MRGKEPLSRAVTSEDRRTLCVSSSLVSTLNMYQSHLQGTLWPRPQSSWEPACFGDGLEGAGPWRRVDRAAFLVGPVLAGELAEPATGRARVPRPGAHSVLGELLCRGGFPRPVGLPPCRRLVAGRREPACV